PFYICGLEDRDKNVWLFGEESHFFEQAFNSELRRSLDTADIGTLIRLSPRTNTVKVFFSGKGSEPADQPEGSAEFQVIYEDRFGRLWFGSQEGYVYLYDSRNGEWTRHDIEKSLISQQRLIAKRLYDDDHQPFPSSVAFSVESICEDAAGRVLFGTPSGLVVLDEARAQWDQYVPENSGLSAQVILCVYRDKSSRIWLGTAYGVMVLE
ncbi:MAG TPA: two-component regulator propeller domain-containing protein, partial [Blastocatellia bacterium]|nr:two-component regulator propeller domain-containing protein [Blastocatellia bacterium]